MTPETREDHAAYDRLENLDTALVARISAPLHDKLSISFVSLTTLIRMKEEANRPQDRADIEQLRAGKDNDANG
jgi:hypothetical protein